VFLGPLKALRRDPPVIYLVLRPWQNYVGIEVGLLLGGLLLLIGFSGWHGGRWALLGLPICLAMVVVGIVRLFVRHRVRIDRTGFYREQVTPGTRLTETWPADDVLSVQVLPVPVPGRFGGIGWRTGVAVTFRNGDTWPLTAGRRPWRERHLARSLAILVGAPCSDRTIIGAPAHDPRDQRPIVGETVTAGPLPPADPAVTVTDTVPRRIGLGGHSGTDLVPMIDHLVIRRRGWLPWPPRRIAWRAITVLGRDAGRGGLLIAQARSQTVIGEDLSAEAVDWLVTCLQAYLPGSGSP
jgi:hypothetical protein